MRRIGPKGLTVMVTKKEIVIRLPLNILQLIIDYGGDDYPEGLKVVNIGEFAKDIIHELTREEENGFTPVIRMLDAAILEALEQGSMGVIGPDEGE